MRWQPEDYRQRPQDLDREVVEYILVRLENGETLTAICEENRDMPLPGTFLRWKNENNDIAARYAQALASGTECRFHEILDAAGSSRTTAALEVAALRHYTERQMPDKYGPRATVKNITRPEGDTDGGDRGGIYAADAAEVRKRIEDIAARREAARRAALEESEGNEEERDKG